MHPSCSNPWYDGIRIAYNSEFDERLQLSPEL